MKNRRKAVQPFEIKKRKIDIFRNYEAYGFEKNQRKFENFSTLISKKSSLHGLRRNLLRESAKYCGHPSRLGRQGSALPPSHRSEKRLLGVHLDKDTTSIPR